MSNTPDALPDIKNRSNSWTLDEKTLSQNGLDMLRHLFPRQPEFKLTDVRIKDGDDNHLDFSATLDNLQPWNVPVTTECSLVDHELERHFLFQFAVPAAYSPYLYLTQYSQPPDEPLVASEENAPYIALAEFVQDFNWVSTGQIMLFSTLDYSASGADGVHYPTSFKTPFKQVQAGLNLPITLTFDDDMSAFLEDLFGGTHSGSEECRALVSARDGVPYFKLSRPTQAGKKIGDFTLALTEIDLALPIVRGADAWPELGLSGKITINDKVLDIRADLDLYYRNLSISFANFPPLADLIDLTEYFPDTLASLLDIQLSELTMVLSLEEEEVSSIRFSLTTEQPVKLMTLSPGNEISIKPTLDLAVRSPFRGDDRQIEGDLRGVWQLGSTKFDAILYFPDYGFHIGLVEGEKLDVDAVFAQILPGIDIPKLEITQIELMGDFLDKSVGIELRMDGASTWKFSLAGAEFELREISMGVVYADGSLAHCGIQSDFELAGAQLTIAGEYESDQGLSILGGTMTGETIDIASLETHLMKGVSLPETFPSQQLTEIVFSAAPKNGAYSFSGRTAGDWKLENNLSLAIERFALSTNQETPLAATLHVSMDVAGIRVSLKADKAASAAGGWQFEGSTGTGQQIPIGHLISDLQKYFGAVSVPAAIADLTIENLHIIFNTQSRDFTFTVECRFPLEGKAVDMVLTIATMRQPDGSYNKHFSGEMKIAGFTFDVNFDQAAGGSELIAIFQPQEQLDLKALVASIVDSPELLALAPPLTLTVTNVLFFHGKSDAQSYTLFALALDVTFSLLDLPLLGDVANAVGIAPVGGGISNLQIVFTTQAFKAAQITTMNALLPAHSARLPQMATGDSDETALSRGFNIVGELDLGDTKLTLSTAAAGSPADGQAAAPSKGAAKTGSAVKSTPPSAPGKWFSVQKGIGPLFVQKIGVRYESGDLSFLVNADLAIAGLTISLEGLGISSPLDKFAPEFHLQGLGIDFDEEAVEIGGTFLHLQGQNLDGTTYEEYSGTLRVSTEELSLSAIGSYANLQGQPSLFAYLALDYPLGGPAFFFVTGFVAGFGYNRTLLPPIAEQVAQFPLVAQAISGTGTPPADASPQAIRNTLSTQMESLHQYIPPALGEYFLAVGITFTSFELLHGIVLLTANFGSRFVLNVIGLLSFATPPELAQNEPALIKADLGIVATFDPVAGFLGLRAVLTNNSYLFDPECHLTGGMAFYSWFSDAHAGEFVLTVGGYHPHFQAPDYYPQVPRLALNWRVSDKLSIQGSAYFALTGHAFMAGGALSAVWQSTDVRVWFNASADFLIQWKPYHYEIALHVEIGATVTIHFFGTHTISLNLEADLNIWGPPFAGEATLKFNFFQVSVHFGPEKEPPEALKWDQFRKAFLPAGEESLISITASGGLIRDLVLGANDNPFGADGSKQHWMVNASDFGLVVDSSIPCNDSNILKPATAFGIAPMKLGETDVKSRLEITLEYLHDGVLTDVIQEDFVLEPVTKRMPAGLWGTVYKPSVNAAPMIDDVLTGFTLAPAQELKPAVTARIPRQSLSVEITQRDELAAWPSELPQISDAGSDTAKARETLISQFMPHLESSEYAGKLPPEALLGSPQETR